MMNRVISLITDALTILREEKPESEAVKILEECLRYMCKQNILDMASMSKAVGYLPAAGR